MRVLSYVILLAIMLIGLTFSALNYDVVTFNYYLDKTEITLSLLLVFVFGAGIVLGFLVAMSPWVKVKRDNIHLRSRLKVIEKELENLRSMPIQDD